MEVAIQNNITTVSFEQKKDNLRDVEKALLNLLKDSLEKNSPITREVILDFYIKNMKGSETYTRNWKWNRETFKYGNTETRKWRDDWNIKSIAIQWFKSNLGGIIIKGKILIIPVIEI